MNNAQIQIEIQHLEEENKKWHKKDKTGHHNQPAGPVDDNGEEEGGKESPGAGKVVWEGGRCEQESKKDWRQVDELCHQEPDGWIYVCVCMWAFQTRCLPLDLVDRPDLSLLRLGSKDGMGLT